MKKLLTLLNIFILISSATFGQFPKKVIPKPIIISGFVPDSCIKGLTEKPEFFFHNQFNAELWHEGRIFPAKITNKKFKVVIEPKGEIAYFQFREGKNSNCLLTSLEMDAFVINAGDSIFINFKTPNDVHFLGRGSEKLNYQVFAGKLSLYWNTLKITRGYKLQNITYFKELASEHLREAMDSLNKIKASISENTYKVLAFNTTAAINSAYLAGIQSNIIVNNFKVLGDNDTTYANLLKSEVINMDIQQRRLAPTDTMVINNASAYISYLAEFILTYNQIFEHKRFPLYTNAYNKIVREYNGTLRDKILAYSINRCYSAFGAAEFVKQALNLVKDSASRVLLERISNAKTPGAKAYDFAFEDTNGKLLKLQDLRGKVVVLEAWFNGCSGCVGLASRMHPVLEYFKNNKNVVFISLGVDRDKKKFLDGVKTGKYGSANSIYLYTNGKGWEHPLCLQYQWVGYPNMLIIDKNGRIITADKSDPKGEEKKAELIALISKHI